VAAVEVGHQHKVFLQLLILVEMVEMEQHHLFLVRLLLMLVVGAVVLICRQI
jgi:hypothetical protein